MIKKANMPKYFLIMLITLWIVTIVFGKLILKANLENLIFEVNYYPTLSVKEVHIEKIGKQYKGIEIKGDINFYKIVTEITNESQAEANLSKYSLDYRDASLKYKEYDNGLDRFDDYVESSFGTHPLIPGAEVGCIEEILILEEGVEAITIYFDEYDNFKEESIQIDVPK